MADYLSPILPKAIEFEKEISFKKENAISDEKFREVADLYEKHFIKEMMKQMKSSLPDGGLIKKNNAEQIFQDQLDDQYSSEWNKSGGFGISDMIYQQLTEKFGHKEQIIEKPKGPIEFSKPTEFIKLPVINDHTYKFSPTLSDELEKVRDLKSPWAGILLNKFMIDETQISYRIKHDNGLESLITTQGGPNKQTQQLSQGSQILAGQSLGQINGSSPLFWTIKKTVS